jgi:hypothetical protein
VTATSLEPATIVFAREHFSMAFVTEMIPLIIEHFKEIARFKDIPLEPSLKHYDIAEKSGMLRVYTARQAGVLTAYSVFNVYDHPHYTGSIQAHEELLYLDPTKRKGSLGDRFIKFCDDQLEQEGVQAIYHTVTVERDFSPLLVRRGYTLCDKVYARRIK